MTNHKQSNARTALRPRFWVFVVGVLLVVLLAAFMSSRRGETSIRTDKVSVQDLVNSISTNGKVEPIENFEAHSPAPTTVKRVLVHEGESVKAGQLLMQLDDADARAQAAKALAQMRAAEADINSTESGGTREEVLTNQSQLAKSQTERDAAERNLHALEKLQQTGAASPAEVQEARNRLARADSDLKLLQQKQTQRYSPPEVEKVRASASEARAAYEAAQVLLKNSNIRAPFDGMVYSIPIRESEFARQGELLLQLANLKDIQVRAFVDEPEIGRLAVGQPVSISWDALPGRGWNGKIVQVPFTVTTLGTRNVGQVVCRVENSDNRLLPNTNVTVLVTLARNNNVLTIAREAVHADSDSRYVYVVEDGHLRRQNVETSISSLTRTEITRGLQAGQVVALGALNSMPLRDGMPIKTNP